MLPTPPLSPKSASPPAAAPDQGDGVAALVGVSRAEPSRPGTLRRAMGDAEVAAYVVSRDGTGDLYAHANTSVPHTQACMAWALVLLRHPLLASSIALNHDLEGSETCLASVAVPVVISSLAPGVSSLAADVAGLVWYRASALDRKLSRLSQLGREHKSCLHVARLRGATALAARRALCAARVEDARVAANNPGLGLGIVIPHRAAPVPLGVLDPDAPAPPAAPRCLLTLTVSEPTYSSDVDSVLVGARMPPGEVGVHAYVAGGKLTLSLAYDVNGAVEGWWADVLGLVSDVLLQ
ncbi:hypothetical protein CcaverHIS002_0411890 [Cutaneotrichosporon cavernicola]|uniref:Uncharacterized protein n=1 Tax=Cutaneotrichosporon cavernicola TaxID=279322 RepID=A0AA48L5L3_9TREE|nr:uncharacterized protein CcaverHIS019_0411830 [Cutaneotrichosporon cavernicola]BEI84585.1 hypothetical protein CcaverHIS002_0411890 [Cutaneotrichosporon cavernicola]BEI92363.1 hypothetical protein CcaverHIS019_0411830 [Cutaneotrichosporon cavernicola]BEJ07903.1 hypothetical protein CcaverHIS641_0411720 [Cutaneotrichosporon cavernicola]